MDATVGAHRCEVQPMSARDKGYGTLEDAWPTTLKKRNPSLGRRLVQIALIFFLASQLVLRSGQTQKSVYGKLATNKDVDDSEGAQVYCVGTKVPNERSKCVWASNEYERAYGRPIVNGAYEQGLILELYRWTRISASGNVKSMAVDDVEVVVLEPAEILVRATQIKATTLTVAYDTGPSLTVHVICKYVRREVRTLFPDDRLRFVSAIETVYKTSEAEGQKLYGSNFHDPIFYNQFHLQHCAREACDGWHAGPAFLNAHVGLMLQFELSIQAVDATVALHYWDPTLDATYKEDWVEHSTIFTDDFFGHINNNNSDNIVDSGRWAYQPIAVMDKQNDNNTGLVLNAYGLMTAPWNTSPLPFVVRKGYIFNHATHFDETIDCNSLAQISQTEHDFSSLIASLNGKLHGTIHGSVAGFWNYNETLEKQVPGLLSFLNFSGLNGINTMTKRFYRWGVIYCPTYCADDVPAVDCVCIRNPRLSNWSSYDILDTYGVFTDIYPALTLEHPDKTDYHYDWLMEQGTNGGRPGTAVNDGSPSDPVFWLIHGFQERFMNTLQFWEQTGRINIDYTWGWNSTSYDGRDASTGFADWSRVDRSTYGMPNVTREAICPGQNEEDISPFGSLLIGVPDRPLTNGEFFNFTFPISPYLPYVYDQLWNWTYCGDILDLPYS